MVKINVDAAGSKATNTVGTGVIACGSVGSIVGIFVKSYEGLKSPRLVEALALRDGLVCVWVLL